MKQDARESAREQKWGATDGGRIQAPRATFQLCSMSM